jgi:hypothetical protein
MPSGFQQDLNQLQPTFYRAVITMSNSTYYPTADGNDNGAVTPSSGDSFETLPSTLALAKARARGNMRFRNIVNALTGLADCQIMDITLTGETDEDTVPTVLAFTVKFDRDAFIPLTGAYQGTTVVGNDIGNSAMDTVAKVVKNEIAKAIRLTTTATMRTTNLVTDDNQISITVTHTGATASETLGTVAVSLIDETTLLD